MNIWVLSEISVISPTSPSRKSLAAILKEIIHTMRLLDRLFNRTEKKLTTVEKHLSKSELEQRNREFAEKFEKVKKLFNSSLEIYNSEFCQCAYPRFQQIVSIDCANTGDSFKCYETDLLIGLVKPYFDIEKSELTDENTNEKWICKKCSSTYEYGWSDFSIYVERKKMKLQNLKVSLKGNKTKKPIPLFLGLMGHSYPAMTEMTNVDFAEFENYMTEK